MNGAPLQPSSPSLRWLTGLRALLCHLCPFSSSLQVSFSATCSVLTDPSCPGLKKFVFLGLTMIVIIFLDSVAAAPAVKTGEVFSGKQLKTH